MSKYTTSIRNICESYLDNEQHDYPDVHAAIDAGRPHIFAFDYDLFDPTYKAELETKILRHYYTREISEETLGLWKLRLEDQMNLILPYYNQLWKSALYDLDPLNDVNYTVTHTGSRSGESGENVTDNAKNSEKSSREASNAATETTDNKGKNGYILNGTASEVSSTSGQTDYNSKAQSADATNNTKAGTEWDLYSDTPQGGLDGVQSQTYLTNARKKTADENSQSSGNSSSENKYSGKDSSESSINSVNTANYSATDESKNTKSSDSLNVESGATTGTSERTTAKAGNMTEQDSYVDRIVGHKSGKTLSEMLLEFRKTFINIDKMFINELEPLFMQLW